MLNKRLIYLMIIIFIFTAFNIQAAEVEYNLTQTIERAEAQNSSLILAELSRRKSELNLKKTRAANTLNQQYSEELRAEINYLTTEKNYRQQRSQIIKEIINSYLNLLAVEKEIEAQQIETAAEQRLFNEMQRRFELSEVNRLNLLDQQNDFHNSQTELDNLEDDYQLQRLNFKNDLKIESDFSLKEITELKIWEIEETEAVEAALENSYDLKIAKIEKQIAEIENNLDKIEAAEIDQKIAELRLKEAEITYQSKRENLESNVLEAYLNLRQAENRAAAQLERVESSKRELEQMERQFELGSATQTVVMQYQAAYLAQQSQYINFISNYYLAVENLVELLNYEPGVIFNE